MAETPDAPTNMAKSSPATPPRPLRPRPKKRQSDAGPSEAAPGQERGFWRVLLITAHHFLIDRRDGRTEFVDTARPALIANDRFDDPDRIHAYDYRPVPRAVTRWLIEELDRDLDATVFVDIGSGRGRTVFEAARHGFMQCLGVEISPRLHADAEQNLRHWPRSIMRCREVEFIRGSIIDVDLPEDPLVIVMADPGNDRLIMRIAGKLAHLASTGQEITLIYINPRHTMPFEQAPIFAEIPIRNWRLKWLSPWPIRIWRTASSAKS